MPEPKRPADENYCPAWREHRMIQAVTNGGEKLGFPACFWCGWQAPEHKAELERRQQEFWANFWREREERIIAAVLGEPEADAPVIVEQRWFALEDVES